MANPIHVNMRAAGGVQRTNIELPTENGCTISLYDALVHHNIDLMPADGSGIKIYLDRGSGREEIPPEEFETTEVSAGNTITSSGKPGGGWA